MSTEKRAALAALLQSEGWRYLKGAAVEQAGAKITLDLIAAAGGSIEDIGLQTARLLAKREALDLLLSWPEREIVKLDKAETQTV